MARRKCSEDMFPGYKRVKDPDFIRLGGLVRDAIASRTLTEFQKLSGVSASTLSRIVNNKFTSPCSDSTIRAIIDHIAPGSGITEDDILRAHGMVPVDEIDIDSMNGIEMTLVRNSNTENLIERSMSVIQRELLNKGYDVTKANLMLGSGGVSYKADYAFITKALINQGISHWGFSVYDKTMGSLECLLSLFFGVCYIYRPQKRGIKMSLVIDDQATYEKAVWICRALLIQDDISIILLGPDKVMDEFQIPSLSASYSPVFEHNHFAEKVKAIVLAAGNGKRLGSQNYKLPKVLRMINGQPMLGYVLQAISFIDIKDTIIVAGYEHQQVIDKFPEYQYAIQEPPLGTGHAVMTAADQLRDYDGLVLVAYGDMPMIKMETYRNLMYAHQQSGCECTILTGTLEDDLPYGRIVRDDNDKFIRIVEDKDCSPQDKMIAEVCAGVFVFDWKTLYNNLGKLGNNNLSEEFLLTDVPYLIMQAGGNVNVHCMPLGKQLLGVNTGDDLARIEGELHKESLDQDSE